MASETLFTFNVVRFCLTTEWWWCHQCRQGGRVLVHVALLHNTRTGLAWPRQGASIIDLTLSWECNVLDNSGCQQICWRSSLVASNTRVDNRPLEFYFLENQFGQRQNNIQPCSVRWRFQLQCQYTAWQSIDSRPHVQHTDYSIHSVLLLDIWRCSWSSLFCVLYVPLRPLATPFCCGAHQLIWELFSAQKCSGVSVVCWRGDRLHFSQILKTQRCVTGLRWLVHSQQWVSWENDSAGGQLQW